MFLARTKQERAGLSLEQCLAALTEATRVHVPVDRQGQMPGPATAGLAERMRGRIYGG